MERRRDEGSVLGVGVVVVDPVVDSGELEAVVLGGRKRTMPCTGESALEPRRWKEGGRLGTWSRCIC